jgi:hypothetical protein
MQGWVRIRGDAYSQKRKEMEDDGMKGLYWFTGLSARENDTG